MANETFYFSHDYNARSDQKIVKLLVKHGMLGYGLYWALIETLYNNNNILEIDYECIAFDLRTDIEIVKSVINDFGLFAFNENTFGSISIEKRLDERSKKSKKAEESANARWSKDEKDQERKKAINCIFYAIKIYDENESFIKVGITTESISRRYSGKLKDYSYEMIFSCENTVEKCIEFEQTIKQNFKNYTPKTQFAGYNECIEISEYDEIISFVMQNNVFRNAKIEFRNAIKERKGKENKEKENKVIEKPIILPIQFSDVSTELKTHSKTKEFCIKTYFIKPNDYDRFVDWFIGTKSNQSDDEIVCFKEWNHFFKEWMKFNYDKLPQAPQQKTPPKFL